MRIHALYNAKGQILAAAELAESVSDDTPQIRPVATPDQYTAEMDIPAAMANVSLREVCEKMMVDVAQNVPCLRARM